MALKNFKKVIDETPKELEFFTEDSMHILERLNDLLETKFQGKQKLLAEKLGKSEAEVSKMLSGVQNFTLLTLCKLKAAFGEPIIAIVTNEEEKAEFTLVKSITQKTVTKRFIGQVSEPESKTYSHVSMRPRKDTIIQSHNLLS